MKKSKRLLALLLSVLMLLTTVISTTVISASAEGTLSSYYKTNPNGQVGANKTISIDGSLSDWDSSMLIAQGTANDDPRVYRPNSMYEVAIDLYALYGAYDDNNLYLMWEMTNVQDVAAPEDNYPLSQGTLWQTQELPFFIAIDTGKADTAIGNNAALTTGGTIWNSGMTIQQSFNKLISINTKGGNGPFIYGGDSTGLNPKEIYGFDGVPKSAIKMGFGKGILSDNVYGLGLERVGGLYTGRTIGDICDENAGWFDFNTKGHNSDSLDFFYELSIPYSELGITKSDVEANGVGVMLVATMGKSGMDCLPYDLSMNDQADKDDAAGSQENNSFEKSDEDFITAPFARIGKLGSGTITPTPKPTDSVVTPTTASTTPTEVGPTEPSTQATTPTEKPSTPIVIPPVVEPTETTPTTVVDPTTVPVPTLDFDDPTDSTPVATTATKPSAPIVVPVAGILGDADESETVNIKDATLIQKHIAKLTTLNDDAQLLADVDANEVLNIRDATNIQKWIAKMPVEYAIGEPLQGGEIVVPTTEATKATTAPDAPIVVPVVTTTPDVEPTETSTTVEPVVTEPQPIVTEPQPIVTEPQYTEPQYTEPDIPDNPVGDTITIYFENTYGWNSVYWHAWNDAGGTNTPWPGDPMTNVSGNIYSAEVSTEFTGIIFNDGSGSDSAKTDNADIAGDGQMYSNGSWVAYDPNYNGGGNDDPNPPTPSGTITIYVNCNNGWGNVYWHGWNSAGGTNTAWPGDPMENIGNGVYKANVDASFTGIVFNDNNGNQTGDLTIAGDGQMYDLSTGSWSAYTGDGGNGGNNGGGNSGGNVGSGDYVYFTDNAGWGTVYCHTWNMDGGTTTWPGVQMEYVDGQYRVAVDSTHTMVKFNNGNGVEGSEAELVIGNTYSN